MKYMILMYGSQADYDGMAGKAEGGQPAWTKDEFAAMGAFMESFGRDLAESGELVDARGLAAPVHTRRIQLRGGVPVVTDGPYAETEEVLARVLARRMRRLRPGHRDRRPAGGLPGPGPCPGAGHGGCPAGR